MELKTRLILSPFLIALFYVAITFFLTGKIGLSDIIIGIGAALAGFVYLWHSHKKAGNI